MRTFLLLLGILLARPVHGAEPLPSTASAGAVRALAAADAALHAAQAQLGIPAATLPPSFWETKGGQAVIGISAAASVLLAVGAIVVPLVIDLRSPAGAP